MGPLFLIQILQSKLSTAHDETKALILADEINHSTNSVLRELIIEHLFVGKALRAFWRRGIMGVEVLRAEIDSFGYDLVMSHGGTVRHIQLKTSKYDAKTSGQKISMRLTEKPSGCVIWILVTEDLEFESFLWFGGKPGEPLPEINEMKVARHTKGNAEGVKTARPDHRVIRRNKFKAINEFGDLLDLLF